MLITALLKKGKINIMYLHLGQDFVIRDKDIIGIFDIEKTSTEKITRDYLNKKSSNRDIIYVSFEMPKSFVVAEENGREKIHITNISTATLKKRANKLEI